MSFWSHCNKCLYFCAENGADNLMAGGFLCSKGISNWISAICLFNDQMIEQCQIFWLFPHLKVVSFNSFYILLLFIVYFIY